MTMLDFYREHQISPVTQAIPDLGAHFARRAFLYRSLGLWPLSFMGKHVLEVGPGSGQNALYVESLYHQRYVLVEPNETGREVLQKTLTYPGAAEIVSCPIEAYQTEDRFDVVLCEGLLGLSGRDSRELLAAIGEKVAIGGVLVITCIDPISQCSDVLRRAMAQRYIKKGASLQENVEILTPIFASHFATLNGMTRSVEDWIVDNLLNPASIGQTFSIPDALEVLDGTFAVLGCSPRFLIDWRWYKEADSSNQWAINSYWRHCHNLSDYRTIEPERTKEVNLAWMEECTWIRQWVRELEVGERSSLPSQGAHRLRQLEDDPGWHGRGQQYLSFVRL